MIWHFPQRTKLLLPQVLGWTRYSIYFSLSFELRLIHEQNNMARKKEGADAPSYDQLRYMSNYGFNDFQIVLACRLELLRKDRRFWKRPGGNWYSKKFIQVIEENTSAEVDFSDLQIDIQKIIPFKWADTFTEMAKANHLPLFEAKLSKEDNAILAKLLISIESDWLADLPLPDSKWVIDPETGEGSSVVFFRDWDPEAEKYFDEEIS